MTVTTPEVRRRSSAQKRLRREADRLDQTASQLRVPVKPDPDDAKGVTAAQMRLVADLLDCPGWGEG